MKEEGKTKQENMEKTKFKGEMSNITPSLDHPPAKYSLSKLHQSHRRRRKTNKSVISG